MNASHQHIHTNTVPTARLQSDNVSEYHHSVRAPSLHSLSVHLRLFFEEARHILINYKGDTAGRSDTDQVGDDAFVETNGAFVPAEKGKRNDHDSKWTLFVLTAKFRN